MLLLSHPHTHIRDTAHHRPFMRPHGRKGGKFKPRALRDLTKQHLKLTIQVGEHDPVRHWALCLAFGDTWPNAALLLPPKFSV